MVGGRSSCVSWLTREGLAEASDKRDHELGFHSLFIRTYSIIHVITMYPSVALALSLLYSCILVYFMHSQLN